MYEFFLSGCAYAAVVKRTGEHHASGVTRPGQEGPSYNSPFLAEADHCPHPLGRRHRLRLFSF